MSPTEKKDFAIRLTKLLNKAQVKVFKEKGFGRALPWSSWGIVPRSGALWTPEELKQLEYVFEYTFAAHNQGLSLTLEQVAAIAWEHGRSANATFQKLKQLYGGKIYKLVNTDVVYKR